MIAAGPHGSEIADDLREIDDAVARAAVLTRQLRALGRLHAAEPGLGAYASKAPLSA